jgi:predicted nucleic acid-binding protein
MIADTTFLSDLYHERRNKQNGPATHFLARHRANPILTTVISAGEIAVVFDNDEDARLFLKPYRVFNLHQGVAFAAAAIDRELLDHGGRLGENDNWIAGFCRYYGQAIISRDKAFDRVQGLRRLSY